MSKKLWILIGVIAIAFAGYVFFNSKADMPLRSIELENAQEESEDLVDNSYQDEQGIEKREVKKDTKPIVVNNPPNTDWKTYRNEKYGFEFSYPQGWNLYSKSENEIWLAKANTNDSISVTYLARLKSTVETDDLGYIQGVVEDEDSKFGHIAYFFNEQESK